MDYLEQNLLSTSEARILVHRISRRDAQDAKLIANRRSSVWGLAVALSPAAEVQSLALATPTEIYHLNIDQSHYCGTAKFAADAYLREILLGPAPLAAFEMPRLALFIHRTLQFHVFGVDLSTVLPFPPNKQRSPAEVVDYRHSSITPSTSARISRLWDDSTADSQFKQVCLRAWLSAVVAADCLSEIDQIRKVDTRLLTNFELKCLSQMVVHSKLLEDSRPTEMKNEFSSLESTDSGELVLHNTRYSNRVRRSNQTVVVMTTAAGAEVTGRATKTRGKSTVIDTRLRAIDHAAVQHVRVVGREELTNADRARDEFVLLVLRGEKTLQRSIFIRYMWFPPLTDTTARPPRPEPVSCTTLGGLNESQRGVVAAMLVQEPPVIVVHGPPGTGKTTTISSAVKMWEADGHPVWVIAQSNVAVKNIALSLHKRHVDFKLLVSQEFYVEWHEHIYEGMEDRLLRSDELSPDPVGLERLFDGAIVVLCTLSMLSNPVLHNTNVFRIVPIERLVVDEASQISVFEYMHLFHKFNKLVKVCFFGDPKQLPPYGKDTVSSLQSVFEIPHLRPQAYFLNTQYRMPIPLGNFISGEVYNDKLLSEHKINAASCVAFVDVDNGQEMKNGNSWQNLEEVHTIVNLVRHYYKLTDFCVITPYDAQRAAIESRLKAEDLPWDRVFNVDSFQGNEAQFVILSVVRTTGPGFLKLKNRVNVMLTRCSAGMVIVTSQQFLRTAGAQDTLIGKLLQHWEMLRGSLQTWTDWKAVSQRTADMPGVLGIRRPGATKQLAPVPPRSFAYVPAAEKVPSPEYHSRAFPSLVGGRPVPPPVRGSWRRSAGVAAIKSPLPSFGEARRVDLNGLGAQFLPRNSEDPWRGRKT